MSKHGQAAKDALDRPHNPKDEPVVRAARILADAIDRLTVALTGTDEDHDRGALGDLPQSIYHATAESSDNALGLRGSLDDLARALVAKGDGARTQAPELTPQPNKRQPTVGAPIKAGMKSTGRKNV